MIGTEVYGYRVEKALSDDKGGFGEVYFARHTTSGAEAVMKVLKPELSAHREIVTRFFNEAKAAAAIQHPGIVAVHNVGYVNERAYLLMERLRGEDLETRLRRGPLPVDVALRFLRQAAGAIGAAHERGIVHRDLKPANLFVVPDPDVIGGERIKVLDFGIAKLGGGGGTMQTQGVFGTPAYMAPEQCSSAADVDARSDLYALGCILYEMISGRPPFGHGGIELIAAHLRDEPPALRAVAPAAPPAVEALAARLLRKKREERPATCAALIAAVDDIQRAFAPTIAPVPSVPPPPPVRVSAPPAGRPARAPEAHASSARPASTTLNGAAGAAATQPARPRSLAPWFAIAGAVIVAAGVAIAVLVAGGDGRKDEAAGNAAAPAAAAPTAAPSTAAPAAPAASPSPPPGVAEPSAPVAAVEAGGGAASAEGAAPVAETPPPADGPPLALVLALDRSGSMSGERLDASKAAVGTVLHALKPGDTLAVVAFDTAADLVSRPRGPGDRAAILADVERIEAGGGSDIAPGVERALAVLRDARAPRRHIVVVTDGAPAAGLGALARRAAKDGITVSAVALPGADARALGALTDSIYRVDDLAQLRASLAAAAAAARLAPAAARPAAAKPAAAEARRGGAAEAEPALDETLSKHDVQAGVAKIKGRVVGCGQKHPATGKVTVRFKISPEGKVESAEARESPDPALGACVVNVVKTATFARSARGISVSYPFVF